MSAGYRKQTHFSFLAKIQDFDVAYHINVSQDINVVIIILRDVAIDQCDTIT